MIRETKESSFIMNMILLCFDELLEEQSINSPHKGFSFAIHMYHECYIRGDE